MPLQVVKQRDIIGNQLLRRNDEIALLYEKIKILEMQMRKGEVQYKERVEDIRVLKLMTHNLSCKNNTLEKRNQSVDDLRFDMHHHRHMV